MRLWKCPECNGSGRNCDGSLVVGTDKYAELKSPTLCAICNGKGIVLLKAVENVEEAMKYSIYRTEQPNE